MKPGRILAFLLGVGACGKPPAAGPAASPALPTTIASVPEPWPAVSEPLPSERSGARDAAVVVAIENYPELPPIHGARKNAADWTRFFTELHGVRPESVATLLDAAATRKGILQALERAAIGARAGGRLWFVYIGHGGKELAPVDAGDARDVTRLVAYRDILSRTARSDAQAVWILDTGFDDALAAPLGANHGLSPARVALGDLYYGSGAIPPKLGRRAPIWMNAPASGFLPGGSRPAFSYLALGALRGWADADGDGGVTAEEVVRYGYRVLRTLRAGRAGPQPDLYSDLECRPLTTLSTLHETPPDFSRALAQLNSSLDARSEEAGSAITAPSRGIPLDRAQNLYRAAERRTDPEVSRCHYFDAAAAYGRFFHDDPTSLEQAEAVLNGGYAYRQAERPDEAAALYSEYVRLQAPGVSGDDTRRAEVRRKYVARACFELFALAKDFARLRPAYLDRCTERRGVVCAKSNEAACSPIVTPESGETNTTEFERLEHEAARLSHEAADRQELASWEPDPVAPLKESRELFRAAEATWTSVGEQSPSDPDRPTSMLRLAEARVAIVALSVSLDENPSSSDVRGAFEAIVVARDSSIGDRRKAAAELGVELADRLLEAQETLFDRTHGATGVEHRAKPPFETLPDGLFRVRPEPIPRAVEAIRSRDEYVGAVAPTDDLEWTRGRHALEAARFLYLYGQFDEARARLEPLFAVECGRSEVGSGAWELLLSIAELRSDARAATRLAQGSSCALDPETRVHEDLFRRPMSNTLFIDGEALLRTADRAASGPERSRLLKEAAALLRAYLEIAPDRNEASEATLSVARIYDDLREHRLAARFYRTFVDRYASEGWLDRLAKTMGAKARAERLRDAQAAYGRLVEQYLAVLDYREAALALLAESQKARFPKTIRVTAARRAAEIAAMRGAAGMSNLIGRISRKLGT